MSAVVAVLIVAVLALSAYYWITRRERYRSAAPPALGWAPPTEVHVDPETGVRQRVWVDPVGGTRHFIDEDVAPGTPGLHTPPPTPVPHGLTPGPVQPAAPRIDAPPPSRPPSAPA